MFVYDTYQRFPADSYVLKIENEADHDSTDLVE